MKDRLKRVATRAKYAAIGGAVGGAVGGLFSSQAASTTAGIGAFVGATVGEKWTSAEPMLDRAREKAPSQLT